MKILHLTLTLTVMLLITLTLNCSSGSILEDNDVGVDTPCLIFIQYYSADNCTGDLTDYFSANKSVLENLENIISKFEIGECVLIDITGLNGYLLNDEEKSWIKNDCG